jgi:hypothetical protein
MSLRQRLLTAAGRAYAQALARSTRVLGQARGAVLRQRPEERLFRRRGRLGIITDAIENKQQLTFWYDNTTDDFAGQRLGDPYGVYTPQEVPGWRLFIMSRIRNPRIEVNLDRSGKPKPFRVRRGYRRFREGRFTIKVRQ